MRSTIKRKKNPQNETFDFVYVDGVCLPAQNIDGLKRWSKNSITISCFCDKRVLFSWSRSKFLSLGYPVAFKVGTDDLMGTAIVTINQENIGDYEQQSI